MYLENAEAMDGSAKNQRSGGRFSPEQGYLSIVCKGATAAIREICEYVGLDADAELAKWEIVKDGRRKRRAGRRRRNGRFCDLSPHGHDAEKRRWN